MALGWSNTRTAFRDRWNRLRPLDRHRLANAVRAYRGYSRNKRGIATAQSAWPMSLSVEPTTSCNLRCPECPSGLRSFTRPTGMLEVATLKRVLDEIGHHLVYLNLYFQGEPYLHPDMNELVRIGAAHGLYTSTSTNAHFLRPERCAQIVQSGLSRLIISIDGMTQDTYASYRVGGQLDKVLEGTRNMVEARRANGGRGPHLVWQFLVVGPNEHEVDTIKQHAQRIGVDELVIKTAQIDQPEDGHPLLTESPELRRYDRNPAGRVVLTQSAGGRMLAHVARLRDDVGRQGGPLLLRQGRTPHHGFGRGTGVQGHLVQSGIRGVSRPNFLQPIRPGDVPKLFRRQPRLRLSSR